MYTTTKNEQAMFKAIKSGKYDFPSPFWDQVESGAKDMIGCLLRLDPEKRYSAQQVSRESAMSPNVRAPDFYGFDRDFCPFAKTQREITWLPGSSTFPVV